MCGVGGGGGGRECRGGVGGCRECRGGCRGGGGVECCGRWEGRPLPGY